MCKYILAISFWTWLLKRLLLLPLPCLHTLLCVQVSSTVYKPPLLVLLDLLTFSSLSTPQPDLPSWGCPQRQCHTDLASPSAPQWSCLVLSGARMFSWSRESSQYNWQHHHYSIAWPNPWYPVQFLSEGLHCWLRTIQCSAHCTHSWRWGHVVLPRI